MTTTPFDRFLEYYRRLWVDKHGPLGITRNPADWKENARGVFLRFQRVIPEKQWKEFFADALVEIPKVEGCTFFNYAVNWWRDRRPYKPPEDSVKQMDKRPAPPHCKLMLALVGVPMADQVERAKQLVEKHGWQNDEKVQRYIQELEK